MRDSLTHPSARNAPCPCGSGRKYKHCCMLGQKAARDEPRRAELSRAHEQSLSTLLMHAKQIRGADRVPALWSEMAEQLGVPAPPGEIPDGENEFFYLLFFWLAYRDRPGVSAAPRTRRLRLPTPAAPPAADSVAEDLLKRRVWQLPPFQRRYIEAVVAEPFTFWELQAVEPGKGVMARDLLTGRERFVHEVMGSRTLQKWDIVFALAAGLDNTYIFSHMVPFAIPARHKDTLMESLRRHLRGQARDVDSLLAHQTELLAALGEMREILFNPPRPVIQNTDGDPLMWTTSTYRFDPAQRDAVLAMLARVPQVQRDGPGEGDDEGGDVFNWNVDTPKGRMPNVHKGKLAVRADRIETATNSVARDQTLRRKLRAVLKDLVRHDKTDYKDFDMADAAEGGAVIPGSAAPTDPEAFWNSLPPEAREQLAAQMDAMHMRWLDEHVPLLGGKTPREAVKTPAGLQQVRQLLRQFDNMDGHRQSSPGGYRFDNNRLRAALGLPPE